jgi:hypothetical protein
MSMIDPERIAELWPALSKEARRQIAAIVEADAGKEVPLNLSREEEPVARAGARLFQAWPCARCRRVSRRNDNLHAPPGR